jgi:tRNA-splicing ligase RtcB
MNIERLQAIDENTWTVRPGAADAIAAAPNVRLYGSRDLLETMDDKVIEQISNVAALPGLVGAAIAMPDAHWGYGFPIGGVAAFDPEAGGIVSAGGVGFDISCGIRCLRTDLTAADIAPRRVPLADSLMRDIPAGVGVEGTLRLDDKELDALMADGARWAVAQGYGTAEDLDYIEETGAVAGAMPAKVSAIAKRRQRGEMGTLGSGNHYLEVQRVERVFDAEAARAFGLAEDQIVVSIHCGSRGLGHQIGTEYMVKLAKAAARLGIALPDRELACAPIRSPEGAEYLGAMNAAINCALANRQILAYLTRRVFAHFFAQARLTTLFDVSHNTCKAETHAVDGRARLLYVHRKGATRALGPGAPGLPARYRSVGQPVIIGGSMGTGSYVLAGLASAEARAWSSASHGAGRAMSRHQALARWRGRALIDQLAEQGILIRTRSMRGAAEEAPGAYKDIERVAETTERAGLARRVALLRPLICLKG